MISTERDVLVDIGKASVSVEVDIPRSAIGTIVIASPLLGTTTSLLAALLNESGFCTLRIAVNPGTPVPAANDLLGGADTIARVVAWARKQEGLAHLPRGAIGIGPAAAMVLLACEEDLNSFDALVAIDAELSRMHKVLERVQAPTLLVAAEERESEVRDAWDALSAIPCDASIKLLAGCESVTSSREAVEQAAADSVEWFRDQFGCA